jgi:peptidoglycan/xylan/chitin deacetylase (PgdA/CDA1 family)
MARSSLRERLRGKYQRTVGGLLYRKPVRLSSRNPTVSFTFDDFPRSALRTGGAILSSFGARGTYYAAFGLMGGQAPTGTMFEATDITRLLAEGHELGCHTFGHCDSWETDAATFAASLRQNAAALAQIAPGALFRSFSYPLTEPHPSVKRAAGEHFASCRAGGQIFNQGTADLRLLKAFFIEKSVRDPERIRALIEANRRANGWLIFATHDVSDDPTPYGCTPDFFRTVVRWSVESGARILTVAAAVEQAIAG